VYSASVQTPRTVNHLKWDHQDVVIDLARFRDLDVIAHTANPTDINPE
jgi:hypothetical protein